MGRELLRFAWRNIWRNRRRTLLTMAALGMGIASLVFFQSYVAGMLHNAGEEVIRTESGHARIINREFLRLERTMPRDRLVGQASAIRRLLQERTEVTAVMERIKLRLLVSHGEVNETVVGIGIDPQAAEQAVQLSRIMCQGSFFSANGQEIIMGRKLAKKMGVAPGDEVLLVASDINFSTYALPFRVAGLFETGFGHYDRGFIYMNLNFAREMLDCGDRAHEFLVYLREPGNAREFAASLQTEVDKLLPSGDVAVVPWQENDFAKSLIPMMKVVVGALVTLVMLIVGLVILNTMLMTVMERSKEIGVIKALGFHDREVTVMLLIEAGVVGLIGALSGGLAGGLLSTYFEKHGISMAKMLSPEVFDKIDISLPLFSEYFYPDFSIGILVSSVIFGLLTAILAVVYPAIKSWWMSPVDAFRSELKV